MPAPGSSPRPPVPMSPAALQSAVARIFPGATPAQARALELAALDHAAWWLRHAREGDRVTVTGDVVWHDPEGAA